MPEHLLAFALPDWLGELEEREHAPFATDVEKIGFAIRLARENVERGAGGPFGAAVFEAATGRLIACGVNLVTSERCSILHAEMVAIAAAQRRLGTYDLASLPGESFVLATSCEPCAMCLGAIPWSGVRKVICGARGEDAESIGFDEGPKPADWIEQLERRNIAVMRDLWREQARQVLMDYHRRGGAVYNAGA